MHDGFKHWEHYSDDDLLYRNMNCRSALPGPSREVLRLIATDAGEEPASAYQRAIESARYSARIRELGVQGG